MRWAFLLLLGLAACVVPSWAATPSEVESCIAAAVDGRYPRQNTAVTFIVKDDRSVADVKVDVSSGDEVLDAKVADCLSRLQPGDSVKPGAWLAVASWKFRSGNSATYNGLVLSPQPPGGTMTPRAIGKAHICVEYYPAQAVHDHIMGTTTVAFRIIEDGTVRDIVVTNSSGSQLLDDAAITCVATWQYRPAEKDGKPVAVPWKAEVRWTQH